MIILCNFTHTSNLCIVPILSGKLSMTRKKMSGGSGGKREKTEELVSRGSSRMYRGHLP